MKTDALIQQDVLEQLKWNPLLNPCEIGVAVKNGIVTLSGQVDTLQQKLEAEKEAKKVDGVRAIAENIHVGVSPSFTKTDTEIAASVMQAMASHSSIPLNKIKVKVEDAVVTLEGEVDFSYERESARNIVVNTKGVRGLHNDITIKPKVVSGDLKRKIKAAFHRSATLDAGRIHLEVDGNVAILTGKVRSFAERDDAEKAVADAPGILVVINKLEVQKELEEEPEVFI